MSRQNDTSLRAVFEVFDAARSLMHRLRWAAAQLHGQGELSAGMRGVLMSLEEQGPQTVPQLARSRPVSRQHIQMMVNPLAAAGLVEMIENPRHKRSKRVQLTSRGKRRVLAMRQREHRVFRHLEIPVPEKSLVDTAATLGALRQLFEGEAWDRAMSPRSRQRS